MRTETRLLTWLLSLLLAGTVGCGNGKKSTADAGPDGDDFDPYMPPPAENPYVDEIFLQEYNHTTPELEPGVGSLVWVGVPPAALQAAYETPTQVTPRGLVTHDQAGALALVTIPDGDPDLIGAAFSPGGLVLAGPGRLYFHSPGGLEAVDAPAGLAITGLASGAGQIYLLTDQGLGAASDAATIVWPALDQAAVTAVLEHAGRLFVAGGASIAAYPAPDSGLPGPADWSLDEAGGLTTGPVAALVAGVELPQALDLVVVGADGLQGFSLAGGSPRAVDVPTFTPGRVPLGEPTSAALTSDGGLIIGTRGGACRIMERGIGPEWRVYNAERWLPDERVRAVATDPDVPDGPIWFATAGGLAWVTAARVTIEEKLVDFVARVVERHDRDGAVADSRLSVRGDLSTSVPYDSDNDGGWTCYWILAECFRYQVTGDPQAKANFDRSLERMLSFRTLTGTDYFLARSVIRKDGCVLDDCDDPDDGEWFTSPDGEWWVKGDTSNDEVTSHMFMMGHAYDLCADEEQRAAIRAHVDGIVGGIVDHGYQLFDVDGQVTTHGQFDPEYVNHPLVGQIADGGRRSAQLLGALTLAYYMTGDSKYLDAERDLIDNHHYDVNVVHECEAPFRQGDKSGDGNELAMQAFFPLLRYEPDPARRQLWIEGWNNTYSNIRPQQAAVWDVVNGVVGGEDPQFEMTGRWFRLVPVDMIRWDMHNSHRLDLAEAPDFYDDLARIRSDGYIVPYDERPCERWNTDQYRMDRGMGGWKEMDAADVLAPYWMGRYYGFIVPAE